MRLSGVDFHPLTERGLCRAVREALAHGRGGTIVTPNVDILRRTRVDPAAAGHVASASYVVADGAPLVWAARLAGTPLPERVAGSSLIWTLSGALAADRRSIYLLGGEPGAACRAAGILTHAYPGLRVAGTDCPPHGFDTDPDALAAVRAAARAAAPDLVFVGLGFPKQERLIAMLTDDLPASWFVGCGAAIGFAAGAHHRAPRWMQRAGLEWLHRLADEPRRLAGRYLVHDAPFALRLLAGGAASRLRRTATR